MATVTGFTAERMQAIENSAIVDGDVVGDNLILKRFDNTTIDAGSVRGPTGSPGVSSEDLENQLTAIGTLIGAHLPVGAVVDYIGTTAPTGWLACQGQTVANGQSLYPALWAKLPTAMKSGSNILLPNTQGLVTVGLSSSDTDFNQIGKTGGEKTHLLSGTELPVHNHSINHDHPAKTSGTDTADHTHAMNHAHPTTSTGEGTSHTHGINIVSGTENQTHKHQTYVGTPFVGAGTVPMQGTGEGVLGESSTELQSHNHNVIGTSAPEASHWHNVSIPSYTGSTGNESVYHAHVVDLDPYTGNSGNSGGGSSHNNVQPFIVFLKIIKAL